MQNNSTIVERLYLILFFSPFILPSNPKIVEHKRPSSCQKSRNQTQWPREILPIPNTSCHERRQKRNYWRERVIAVAPLACICVENFVYKNVTLVFRRVIENE